MTTWPATIQDVLSVEGFSMKANPQNIRTDMESGPAKVRRRFTKKIVKVKGSIYVTAVEKVYLDDFYDTTLEGGTQQFTWVDPITAAATDFRFSSEIEYSAAGPTLFRASFELEVM